MGTKSFSINEAVNFGWRTVKKRFWFFVQIFIIVALIAYGPGVIMQSFDKVELPTLVAMFFFLAGIIFWVVQLLISIGLIQVVLAHVDSRKSDVSDLFTGTKFLVNYFLSSLAFGLVTGVGILLLVIPGLILIVRLQFYPYLIVDKGVGPIEALKGSWNMTAGSFWNLVLLALAAVGINMLGAVALGIGLLWSIPTTVLAVGWVYRRLSQHAHA